MIKNHKYSVSVGWTGNKGTGTSGYRTFDRSYSVRSENKAEILCSADPAFQGDSTKYNPEELLVASLSSCHMLWYLHVCAEAHVVVITYNDIATGLMEESAEGSGFFKQVTLHPVVTITEQSMVNKAIALHEKAHELCFIANSVSFEVTYKVTVNVE